MQNYKVGETINFRVRINGNPVSDNPTAIVRDHLDAIVDTLTLGSGLSQVGGSRQISGSFVPSADGVWTVQVTDDKGLDVIQQYNVGDYSLVSVGANVATNEAKLDAVLAAISGIEFGGGHFG